MSSKSLLLLAVFVPLGLNSILLSEIPAKPQYGSWGFDLAGADRSVKPGDDFFRFANGKWINATQIPPDKPSYSLRLAMSDLIEKRLHEMMETSAMMTKPESPPSLSTKVGLYYRSFMDEAAVQKVGAQAIAAELGDIKKAKTREDLARLMGRTTVDFEESLFNFVIEVDLKDPNHYAFYLTQAGLGLPDRDYYLKADFATQKAAYEKYVATLLRLVNWPEPDARAKDILNFETSVAEASWTKAQQRDRLAIYNPMSLDELEKHAPGFPWRQFLTEAKMEKLGRVIVAEKSAFPKLSQIYSDAPMETIAAWSAFHLADNAAPYLSKPFTDAYFELQAKTLSGQKEQ